MRNEVNNYRMYDAMATCSDRFRQTRSKGAFRLYLATLAMWQTLAR